MKNYLEDPNKDMKKAAAVADDFELTHSKQSRVLVDLVDVIWE